MQQLQNLLLAIILLIGLSLALDAAGIDLSTDFDGKQVALEIECSNQSQLKPNGVLWQQSLICKE